MGRQILRLFKHDIELLFKYINAHTRATMFIGMRAEFIRVNKVKCPHFGKHAYKGKHAFHPDCLKCKMINVCKEYCETVYNICEEISDIKECHDSVTDMLFPAYCLVICGDNVIGKDVIPHGRITAKPVIKKKNRPIRKM